MNLDFNIYWQKIQNNEEEALETLYKATFGYLAGYSSEITGNFQLAEEVVQDVFLRLWLNRSELTVNVSFKAYLLQMVHNHSLNVLRQQKTRKESVNLIGSEKTWQFISDTYDLNDNIIERIFTGETEVIIEHAIKELPEQCGRIFRMSRFESMKNGEIATKLCLSENTVKSHIYNALQKIALALKKEK